MKVTIIAAKDIKELDPAGKLKIFVQYEFTLDEFGPFIHKIPIKEDTLESLRAEIDRRQAILTAK